MGLGTKLRQSFGPSSTPYLLPYPTEYGHDNLVKSKLSRGYGVLVLEYSTVLSVRGSHAKNGRPCPRLASCSLVG